VKDHLLQSVLAQPVERRANLAREYLQLYLLRLMHDAGSTGDLAFVGGTALRLLHRIPARGRSGAAPDWRRPEGAARRGDQPTLRATSRSACSNASAN